jgi:predicted ArsR family transcriptional regulator
MTDPAPTQPRLPSPAESGLARLAPLHDPVRRRVYAFVASRGSATRDEAAAAAGIDRPLAAFHLERLLEAGLVEVDGTNPAAGSTVRHAPRRGRGRPAKRYRAAALDVEVSLPARDYRLAAEVFTDALAMSERAPELDAVAYERGRALGRKARATRTRAQSRGDALPAPVLQILVDEGYAPEVRADATVCLANCPFDALARRQRDVMCPTNRALLRGVLAGAGVKSHEPRLDPAPGRCCVVIDRVAADGAG